MKKLLWCTGGLLLMASMGYFILHKKAALPLKTIQVMQGSISDKATAIGQILPERSVKIKSQVSGIVAKLLHSEGDYVKEGDTLLQIQPLTSPGKYDELKREAEIKRVVEQARKVEFEIIQAGYAQKSTEAFKYHQVKGDYQAASLERQRAEEQLALAEKGKIVIGDRQISSEIKSPISGHILARQVNEGDPVVAQSEMQAGDVLFTLADMQQLLFRGEVNELDAVKLKEDLPATLTIGALPDITIKGKIRKIALQSEQASEVNSAQSQTEKSSSASKFNVGFKIEIGDLQIPTGVKLKSGYSATAEIIVKQARNVLLVPERLLVFKEGKVYVQLPDKDKGSKLQLIKTGISDGINVEVVEGLKLGQDIIDKPMEEPKPD